MSQCIQRLYDISVVVVSLTCDGPSCHFVRAAHICWEKQKMKVNLGAQVLSSSVADALEYCAKHLKLRQFEGCMPTVRFIRIFDHLFDILNSQNPLGKGFKSPLRKSNQQHWGPFLEEAYSYISGLKDA